MRKTVIISAFPGVGKTIFFNMIQNTMNSNFVDPDDRQRLPIVIDADSSKFSWSRPGERNPDFPNNYIKFIKDNIGKADIIFVSTHKEVRDALKDSGIKYVLVYPKKFLKVEYIERFKTRGSPKPFIDLMNEKWDEFIDDLIVDSGNSKVIQLSSNEYLFNVVVNHMKDFLSTCYNQPE